MANKYRAWTDGEVLTSANLIDYVQKNVVIPCDSSADYPDSSTRREGMAVYDKDADKLLIYSGSSTTGWTPPWNMPWGIVSYATTTTASGFTTGTTEKVISTATAFTAKANRYYRVSLSATGVGDVAGDLFQIKIRKDDISGTDFFDQRFAIPASPYQFPITVSAVITSVAAGSNTLVATLQRVTGTGTAGTTSGNVNRIIVEDIGPNGAPA